MLLLYGILTLLSREAKQTDPVVTQ